MLATPSYTFTPSQHSFLPLVPSPLSPRRTDGSARTPRVFTSFMTFSSPPQQPQQQQAQAQAQSSPLRPSPRTPFSARPIRAVPTEQQARPDALRQRRRDLFLKKIKQERDDARWESRIEDMARLDYRTEMHRWEVEHARSAPATREDEAEEQEQDMPRDAAMSVANTGSNFYRTATSSQEEEEEAEAVLRRENEELEALLSMMGGQQLQDCGRERDGDDDGGGADRAEDTSVFGSDDEDYDSIFTSFVEGQGNGAGEAHVWEQQQQQQDVEAMDLS